MALARSFAGNRAAYDDRDGVIWQDGALVPWRGATLHVLNHGLHYGGCVFEGARAYGGHVFELTRHNRRLHESAALLGFQIPFSVEGLDAATRLVVARNGAGEAYVRTIAWRGSEEMGVSGRSARVHVAICSWAMPAAVSQPPVLALAISRWARPAPSTAPTAAKAAGLYMISTLAKQAAEDEGFDDALLYDWRGLVAEATSSNLFLVIDGRLHTPVPEGFLDGITRSTVMELARKRGVDVIERHVPAADLARASEAFLTGTAIELVPVKRIGSHVYNPGRLTDMLINAYADLVRRQPASPQRKRSASVEHES
jgi:branched-chain amino acid aminotransferase